MPVRQSIENERAPVKIFTDEVEPTAYRQLVNLARLSIIHGHVAAMPDVHAGIGSTVGAVIPTHKAIIPAAVGVDIGCGMNAVRLSLKADALPDNMKPVRSAIENAVPVGFARHPDPRAGRGSLDRLRPDLERIFEKHPTLRRMHKDPDGTWACQLGTLGGGNHFIEICIDELNGVWIMLHSGSRGIGNAIGTYFIKLAKDDMERHLRQLPDDDLAYFQEGAAHFDDYVAAVTWAQSYAMTNRREMMRLVIDAIGETLPPFTLTEEAINCHHNYVVREHHFGAEVFVTRKGAIRAGKDELGIIPGSMGAKSYIVRGKGSEESLESCAHGAGRRMSRREAKRRFSPEDLERQTRGVECRKDKGVVDEIPGAYKDIDSVMANQTDLVE
ncbi:MAG TPA: RtcB family protein, partial [Gammaproteobacteria bacterium]|nr:RtcB family protein [Gammaproteobacteria bacterium]